MSMNELTNYTGITRSTIMTQRFTGLYRRGVRWQVDTRRNNECTGLSNITFNVLFCVALYCRYVLRFSTRYVIIYPEQRKETRCGYLYARNRRILYARRDRGYSQSYRGYCYAALEAQKDARIQNRRLLESEQSRVSRVRSSTEEHTARSRQLKNKATFGGWHGTTKFSAAVGLMVQACKTFTRVPKTSCAIFMIHDPPYKIKVALCKYGHRIESVLSCIEISPICILAHHALFSAKVEVRL